MMIPADIKIVYNRIAVIPLHTTNGKVKYNLKNTNVILYRKIRISLEPKWYNLI